MTTSDKYIILNIKGDEHTIGESENDVSATSAETRISMTSIQDVFEFWKVSNKGICLKNFTCKFCKYPDRKKVSCGTKEAKKCKIEKSAYNQGVDETD